MRVQLKFTRGIAEKSQCLVQLVFWLPDLNLSSSKFDMSFFSLSEIFHFVSAFFLWFLDETSHSKNDFVLFFSTRENLDCAQYRFEPITLVNFFISGGAPGDLMTSALVRQYPDQTARARALAGDIVQFCSWGRHLTLTVHLSTEGGV